VEVSLSRTRSRRRRGAVYFVTDRLSLRCRFDAVGQRWTPRHVRGFGHRTVLVRSKPESGDSDRTEPIRQRRRRHRRRRVVERQTPVKQTVSLCSTTQFGSPFPNILSRRFPLSPASTGSRLQPERTVLNPLHTGTHRDGVHTRQMASRIQRRGRESRSLRWTGTRQAGLRRGSTLACGGTRAQNGSALLRRHSVRCEISQ